jgi:glutathione S-transferase
MTAQLDFYTHPQSRGSIVRWMLEESGASYETHALQYGSTMKDPDYLAINPMGKVPAIRHGGQVVTETAAICAYLADAFPTAQLAPPPEQRGAYYRWLFFAAGPLEAAIINQALKVELSPEQQGFVGYGSLTAVLDVLEHTLDGRQYIAGDAFSAADVYLGAQLGWGLKFKTIDARSPFVQYVEHLHARPAWQRALEKDAALAASAG